MKPGQIVVHSAKIASGTVGSKKTLLHVPSNRFVVLHDQGELLWQKIEGGQTDILALIQDHANTFGVPVEVAAYEVISFLDELRAEGFIDYRLERERETAPLLDAQTGLNEARAENLLRLIAGQRPYGSPPVQLVVPLTTSSHTTLADMAAQAGKGPPAAPPPPSPHKRWVELPTPSAFLTVDQATTLAVGKEVYPAQRRVVVLHGPDPDLTADELETIAVKLEVDKVPVDKRGGVALFDQPRGDLSLGEIEHLPAPRAMAMRVIIIIIDDGSTIIIIVISDGGGGSSGRSRSACKTMCV